MTHSNKSYLYITSYYCIYWYVVTKSFVIHIRSLALKVPQFRYSLKFQGLVCSPNADVLLRNCSLTLSQSMSVATRHHFFWQDTQWPPLAQKRFRSAQWLLGRLNPGCRIVGSSTRDELTTALQPTSIHSSHHWERMSVQRGLRDGRHFRRGKNK